jgi:hypothetical protein
MTIQAEELAILRANTTEFINADFKDIVLNRVTRTSNGAGGYTEEETPVDAQRMRLIPQQGNMSPLRETLDGEAVQPDYVLLGEWNADLMRWDTFVDLGRRYQVLFVHEKSSYERKGEVKYLGEA